MWPLASQDLAADLFRLTSAMLADVTGWAQLFRMKAVENGARGARSPRLAFCHLASALWASAMNEAIAPLTRDRHLFGPGPKRILALDGGGLRGTLSIAFLERMELLLAEAAGTSVRLCDAFDLIGGTSTGAILSGGLALGHSAGAMHDLYARLGPRVFRRNIWRIQGLRAKFDAARLREEMKPIVGERTLDSPDLLTGFCVVIERMDYGQPLDRLQQSAVALLGASAGCLLHRQPVLSAGGSDPSQHHGARYFDPELLDILGKGELGLFVDGGVTPHNNPSLHLTFLATLPQHGIGWPLEPGI